MRILVTGGAGYIGSHTVLELLENNYEVVVVDNLSNSQEESLRRVTKITNKSLDFHEFDLRDENRLNELFSATKIDGVIHFAGLKAVGESVLEPLNYYSNNLGSTLTLLKTMKKFGVHQLVFSSSCTVYGQPDAIQVSENTPIQPTSPYGQTKAMIEQILKDVSLSDKSWKITILRYFNPIGAHQSGKMGEDPNGIPNNLLPYTAQVAVGKLKFVSIFGNDYDTPDGTGVRDYIHVVDLAKGHIAALKHTPKTASLVIYNLGTGKGSSVLDVLAAFEKASGKKVPYVFAPRRPGDVSQLFANVDKAHKELNWQTEKDLLQACQDTWHWQSSNPNGYN